MTRPVYAQAGAESFRWIRITENTGKDITASTVQVVLLPYPNEPTAGTTGQTPDGIRRPSPNVVEAALEVTDTYDPGLYGLYGKITDEDEVEWMFGGLVEVK